MSTNAMFLIVAWALIRTIEDYLAEIADTFQGCAFVAIFRSAFNRRVAFSIELIMATRKLQYILSLGGPSSEHFPVVGFS